MTADLSPGLYEDERTGQTIVTQSMIKTFRRCPRKYYYKYVRRLKPREMGKPLTRGKWLHTLLEAHYSGGDWKDAHRKLKQKFAELLDEEQENLGDLPGECYRIMRGYVWHYQEDDFVVSEVEKKLEAELPGEIFLRARVDLLTLLPNGRVRIVDHKTHKKLPDLNFRMLDVQSPLYVWIALRNDLDVQDFMWNYLRTSGLKLPEPLKSGARLSRWDSCDVDYLTAVEAIKRGEVPVKPHTPKLKQLKAQRFQPDRPQASTFFRREVLERSDYMLSSSATSALHTARQIEEYPWGQDKAIERVTDRSCGWCEFRFVCMAELSKGPDRVPPAAVSSRYVTVDPMAYYDDEKDEDLLT